VGVTLQGLEAGRWEQGAEGGKPGKTIVHCGVLSAMWTRVTGWRDGGMAAWRHGGMAGWRDDLTGLWAGPQAYRKGCDGFKGHARSSHAKPLAKRRPEGQTRWPPVVVGAGREKDTYTMTNVSG
jgi:hypothetical protein